MCVDKAIQTAVVPLMTYVGSVFVCSGGWQRLHDATMTAWRPAITFKCKQNPIFNHEKDDFYGSDDPTNSVKQLKDNSWSVHQVKDKSQKHRWLSWACISNRSSLRRESTEFVRQSVFENHVRHLTLRLAKHVCQRFVVSAGHCMLCYCLWFWTSMKHATTDLAVELWAGGSHVISGNSAYRRQIRRLFLPRRHDIQPSESAGHVFTVCQHCLIFASYSYQRSTLAYIEQSPETALSWRFTSEH